MSGFPEVLRSNAFTGANVASGALTEESKRWGILSGPPARGQVLSDFEKPIDLHKWEDERVGYGIVALTPAGRTDASVAANADLPESVRELIARRKAPVLRFTPGNFKYLTNYKLNRDFEIASWGIGNTVIPQYLLILGGPDEIPWRIQFLLNARRYVGRVPLSGAALDNYLTHVMDGWPNSSIDVNSPVVWSPDYNFPDITELLHKVIARPLYSKYAANSRILEKATMLEVEAATRADLMSTLSKKSPGLIVSTSHGLIAPLDRPREIAANIGSLVDQNRQTLDSEQLLASWQPDGAIWYAHACCSAGSDGASKFQNLVGVDSDLGATFTALTAAGPSIAPLPVRLLSAKKPARAFIGHVEPTFDITLRNSDTGELFTKPIIDALYEQLLQQNSVGFAMQYLLSALASVHSKYVDLIQAFQPSDDSYGQTLTYSLRGSDIQGTILIGDPTVALPSLP